MNLIKEGIIQGFTLLITPDPEVWGITFLSLKISLSATLISLISGLSIALAVALNTFPGKKIAISLINTGMALPPVVVGLIVTLFLWRSGPLGTFGLLYTPVAMIIAQALIATPIIAGISLSGLQNLPAELRLQLLSLGANRRQLLWTLIKEARLSILAALMAGFGGVISEVGASMMVGGNIKGSTRVLTTATVMETSKGNFEIALALGFILLIIAFSINAFITHIQQQERK